MTALSAYVLEPIWEGDSTPPNPGAGPYGCRCLGSPPRERLNGSSSLEENFPKRIDLRTNFLAAVTLSTAMKHLRVEKNHRGAFRIPARTPPEG